jgi:hypothetical protein
LTGLSAVERIASSVERESLSWLGRALWNVTELADVGDALTRFKAAPNRLLTLRRTDTTMTVNVLGRYLFVLTRFLYANR